MRWSRKPVHRVSSRSSSARDCRALIMHAKRTNQTERCVRLPLPPSPLRATGHYAHVPTARGFQLSSLQCVTCELDVGSTGLNIGGGTVSLNCSPETVLAAAL